MRSAEWLSVDVSLSLAEGEGQGEGSFEVPRYPSPPTPLPCWGEGRFVRRTVKPFGEN